MKNKMLCPNCGNDEYLALVETRKGRLSIWIKALVHFVCAILFIWGAMDFKNDRNIWAFMAVAIVWIIAIQVIKMIEYQRRRKTSTKVVCEKCGKTWFID